MTTCVPHAIRLPSVLAVIPYLAADEPQAAPDFCSDPYSGLCSDLCVGSSRTLLAASFASKCMPSSSSFMKRSTWPSNALTALSACPAVTKSPMRFTAVAGVASMHSHRVCGHCMSLAAVSSSALRRPFLGSHVAGMFSIAAARRISVFNIAANELPSVDVNPMSAMTARAGTSR